MSKYDLIWLNMIKYQRRIKEESKKPSKISKVSGATYVLHLWCRFYITNGVQIWNILFDVSNIPRLAWFPDGQFDHEVYNLCFINFVNQKFDFFKEKYCESALWEQLISFKVNLTKIDGGDKDNETSQELRMLSSVTLDFQVTKIVMISGSQL